MILVAAFLLSATCPAAQSNIVSRTFPDLYAAIARRQLLSRFELTGTVTYNSRLPGGLMAVQDGQEGIAFWNDSPPEARSIRPGDRVRIAGHLTSGRGKTVSRNVDRLEVLAHGPLPEPLDVSAADLRQRDLHFVLARIEGTLTDAFPDEIDREWIFLTVKCRDGIVFAGLRTQGKPHDLTRFIGKRVSVTGIYDNDWGNRRMIGKALHVDSLDSLQVLPSPDDRESPLGNAERMSYTELIDGAGDLRCHASGNVIATWDGNRILLRTDSGRLILGELLKPALPSSGERIRLVGFPETDLYGVILIRADWQHEDGAAIPDEMPADVTPGQILAERDGALRYDYSLHGRPVRLSGIVRCLPIGNGDGRMYLESEGRMVAVDVGSVPAALDSIRPGFTVSACGTCVMETEKMSLGHAFPHITGYRIVARTPDDISIISRPPWWTPVRLLLVIGTLILVIAGFFVWNIALRRAAERKGMELLSEQLARIESELKVSERTRLSVELHDALSQNLIGASMEINTAEQIVTDEDALRHLNIASKTLKSSRDELRNCLWDLRSAALEERDMNAAIRKTLAPYIEDVDLQVRFNVPRNVFSDNTAHALMRIIRELVLNAIRHGHARTVRIAGSRENGRLLLSVRDDGVGFDPDTAPGITQGHFGLQGVKERLRLLKGRLEIDSSRSNGTKVTASLELPPSDRSKI